jgi:hypothetical protein
VKLETLEVIIAKIKCEIELTDTFTSEEEESILDPTVINTLPILSYPEAKVSISRNPEEHYIYTDSSPIATPIFTSGKPKEPDSSFPFPPHLDIPSPHDLFPKVVERSVVLSFEVFENLLFSPRSPSPKFSMASAGGASGAGGGGGGQAPPPKIFAKFSSRYAPLVFPAVFHDLPENYLKNLPKFMG